MNAAQQQQYARRQQREQQLQAAYQRNLKARRKQLEAQAKAKGGLSPQLGATINQMANTNKSMTIADFFRAIYDILPDRWATFAAMLELYALYQVKHEEQQEALLGVPRLYHTPMMAPYRGDGKSVVDAVFAKAEAQGARTRVVYRGKQ